MKVRVALTLPMAAIALTGCTTTEAGTAVPAREPPAATSSEAGPSVPTVADPLDATRYVADPCAVLTPSQLASYGVSRTGDPKPPSTFTDFSQPTCFWLGEAQAINVSVSWLTSNKNGLADTYDIQDKSEIWDYFEAAEVEEYPAVFNYFAEDPQYGNCHVTVGISDRLTYTVNIQGQGNIEGEASCDLAEEVAVAVIRTLKEGP